MKLITIALSSLVSLSLLASCSNNADSGANSAEKQLSSDPLTIQMAIPSWANADYDNIFVKSAKEKFPNITLEQIQISGDGNYETDLLAKGFKPDIILTGLGTSYLIPLKETGLAYDMTNIAKAAKLDLSRLEPVRLNYAQNLDGNPDLTVIPYMLGVAALFYNKDIFDRFGVSYPKDRMTWNQTIELAKKVTRESDGVQYRGFEADEIIRKSQNHPLNGWFCDFVEHIPDHV